MAVMRAARWVFPIAILFLFILSGVSFSAEKVFVKEYIYKAGKIDNEFTASTIAIVHAKRLVNAELGAYLKRETVVKNFKLTQDEVNGLAAASALSEIFDEKWDGKTYYLKARINADIDKVVKSVTRFYEDGRAEEADQVQMHTEIALIDIERLGSELDSEKNDKAKQLAYMKLANVLSATVWNDKAWFLFSSGDYEHAIAPYTKTIELDPAYAARHYVNRGVSYLNLKQYDKAVYDFSMVISLKPPYVAIGYENRGLTYLAMKKFEQALEDLNKVISLQPYNAKAYSNRGVTYENKGQYDRAIEDYNKAIAIEPDYADAYYNRGNVYRDKGQHDRALEDYDKVILLKPDYASVFISRGNVYNKKGQYHKAIEDFNMSISLMPNNSIAYYNRGNAYRAKGQKDMAIADYKKNCELGDNDGCRQVKEMKAEFSKVISSKPDNADAYYNRGNAYKNKGQYDRAIEDYSKAISLKIDYAEAYSARGNTYFEKGQHDRAIEDYNKVISLKPDDVLAYFNLGIMFYKKGQNGKALENFKKACALGHDEGCKGVKGVEALR
ncbi:MAG: tetratricopeptide repeat protein [Deltaproteobacteria bacterium]|nr:tetratricopeptide repeat protein [Deltaproteobacteria bacterium]